MAAAKVANNSSAKKARMMTAKKTKAAEPLLKGLCELFEDDFGEGQEDVMHEPRATSVRGCWGMAWRECGLPGRR